MSKIIATDNFETSNWGVKFENLASNYADLFIGFTDNAPIIEFDNLKFKFELSQGNDIVLSKTYPPSNIKYIRSDQEYLVVQRLNLKVESEYKLYLWAENGGNSFETTINFTTPRPNQPYPSWIWDGSTWLPPIPYPNENENYYWDEDLNNWQKEEIGT
jgi:hypothetical protein